jgi:hypothetical protein
MTSMHYGLLLAFSAQFALTTGAVCQTAQPVVAQHQRCVLHAVVRETDMATDYDPTLLDKAMADCEKTLLPLKKSIIARTRDPAFAESILEKIRAASRRGAAVALLGFLEGRSVRKPATAQSQQNANALNQTNVPATLVAPGAGMLDGIDPNAGGIHIIGGKP